VATLVFMAVPAYILLMTGAGGWAKFWTLFGASNQLLAALTLITLTVWLRRSGKPFLFVFLPMLFVLVITLWALIRLLIVDLRGATPAAIVNAIAAGAFIVLAIFLAGRAWQARGQAS
jgi:carbon starvation protein